LQALLHKENNDASVNLDKNNIFYLWIFSILAQQYHSCKVHILRFRWLWLYKKSKV